MDRASALRSNLYKGRGSNLSTGEEQKLEEPEKAEIKLPNIPRIRRKPKYQPNRLGKLEALKFKMEMQNKNLKMLTEHSYLMSNIYEEDRSKKSNMRRENNVFQNQQIMRIEKDLEKTSKMLQTEVHQLQRQQEVEGGDGTGSQPVEILNEKILSEIDTLFDDAEAYFKKKQEHLNYL